MGGVIFQMYYGFIESKLLIILTKHISSERDESHDSIVSVVLFCDRSSTEREMYIFVTEKCMKVMQWCLDGTRRLFVA